MLNYSRLADEQLVAAYAKGDNQSFDILLRRHQERVFNYVLSIVRDPDTANDIFQETFIKAITTIKQGRYMETGKFAAWITRIAHNLIIDYYRQERSGNMTSADDETANVLNRKEFSDENIEDILVDEQIRADVRRIVAILPDNQREVLEMRYYRDMSFKEIAEATQVSINTALGRMRYAILNLRRIVKENNISLTS
jgi:RNA polymerase sigma-70 factor (ECF subfamily)